MHLSKDEFNKLPKKTKVALMATKSTKKTTTNKKKKSKSSSGKPVKRRQASVAAAYASPNIGSAPRVKSTRDTCNIQHRELISGITGASNFALPVALAVNPGLKEMFPWLSIMAQGWEEYRFRSLRLVYKTRTGSTTPGSLMMAPDYDSSDANPASEQIMSTFAQCIEDVPWKDITCVFKPSNLNSPGKRHFVRNGPLSANQDVKLYDVAKFFLAVMDGTATPWGKLWVEYDIDFYIPQLPSQGAVSNLGGKINGGGTLTPANPLGTVPIPDTETVGVTVNNNSNVTLVGPCEMSVVARIVGTGLTGISLANLVGCTQRTPQTLLINNGSTEASISFVVAVSGASASFDIQAAGTTVTQSIVLFANIPVGAQ